jgi:hypothetical protein
MSMLFDGFSDRKDAAAFAAAVKSRFGLDTAIYDTRAASDEADPFPFELTPPVVHVERAEAAIEDAVENFVLRFNGVFAGT